MARNAEFFFEVRADIGDGFDGEGIFHNKSIIRHFRSVVKCKKEKGNSFEPIKRIEIICFLYYNIKGLSYHLVDIAV